MTATPDDGIPKTRTRARSGSRALVRAVDPTAEAVLAVVLEAIDRPAFVVGPALSIRNANGKARALLDGARLTTLAVLESALGSTKSDLPRAHIVRVIPIPCPTGPLRLCVLEPTTPPADPKDRLGRAVARFGLTPRQTAILAGVTRGASNKQIGVELGCSVRTVELHVSTLLDRMGAKNRTMLVALFNEL